MSITSKILEQIENATAGLTTYETPADTEEKESEEVLKEMMTNNDFGDKNEVNLRGTSTGGTKTYQTSNYVDDFLSTVNPDVNLVIKEKDKPFDSRIKNINDYDRHCCGSSVTSKVMSSFNGLL